MSAIFLDRDGVLIRKAPEGEYITHRSQVEFLPGALPAAARLSCSGWKVIIVTNQRGVATGRIQEASLHEIHATIQCAISRAGGALRAVYYCPHDIPAHCACRKPHPGMLLKAAAEHDLYLPACWMIGDRSSDIEAGKAAGCNTAFVGNCADAQAAGADLSAASLAAIAEAILTRGAQVPRVSSTTP